MDIAQPGFEPRACRDIGELSYFEQCIVTPLPVKSMLRAVCMVAHVGVRTGPDCATVWCVHGRMSVSVAFDVQLIVRCARPRGSKRALSRTYKCLSDALLRSRALRGPHQTGYPGLASSGTQLTVEGFCS